MTRVLRWSQWVAVKYNISWQCKAKDKKLVRAWLKTLFLYLVLYCPKNVIFLIHFLNIFFSIHTFLSTFSISIRHPQSAGRRFIDTQNILVLQFQSCTHLISVAHWDLCYLSALKTRLWMAKDKKREESFGESKKRILAVSTRIKETRCGIVEETHRNG